MEAKMNVVSYYKMLFAKKCNVNEVFCQSIEKALSILEKKVEGESLETQLNALVAFTTFVTSYMTIADPRNVILSTEGHLHAVVGDDLDHVIDLVLTALLALFNETNAIHMLNILTWCNRRHMAQKQDTEVM